MTKQKLNIAIGRFQPFTQGHLNMVNEGEAPCIVYRINSSNKEIQKTKNGIKIGTKSYTNEAVNHVIEYIENPTAKLTELEKELLKRPFTNELIEREMEIVKKSNKNILDVVSVVHVYDALGRYNAFLTEHSDEYEVGDWMCGDDRKEEYEENIEKMSKYTELETEFKNGKKLPNILIGKLNVNTGKGRTAGVSGTDVRKSILNKDKAAFEKIMPKGTAAIFGDLTKAFDEFKVKLQGIMKEDKLKNYISKNMKTINEYFESSNPSGEHSMQIIEEGQGDYIIYFNSPAALLIYKMELEGQVSDGYWENARPYDHWKWVTKTEPKLDDKKLGYTGPWHQKRYSTEWVRRYVKRAVKGDKFDYSWTIRIFNYAKFGSILNKTQLNKVLSDYAYRSMIEKLPQVPVTNAELDADFADKQYVKEYWDKTKTFFTDDLLKKYYDSDYGFSQFEEDLKEAETAMNTQFFEEQ